MDRLSFVGSYLGAFDGDRAPPVTPSGPLRTSSVKGVARHSHHAAPMVP
jgi:hypothetical protein